MNESEHLSKKTQEKEKIVRKLESDLKIAREQLLLYRRLYDLEARKGIIPQGKLEIQLEIPLEKHKRKPFEKAGRLSIAEAAKQMLEECGKPLHGRQILEKLPAYGASAKNLNTVQGTLVNRRKMFKNIGRNTWVLRKDASVD